MRIVGKSPFFHGQTTRLSFAAGLFLAIALLVGPWASSPTAQSGTFGQWATLPNNLTINPIHMALLNTGKVLVVAGSGNDSAVTNWKAAVIDPQTGAVTKLFQQMPWDMFCNGMVTLPDGRVFINGGNLKYDPFWGEPRNAVFDPVTETFADVENMAHGRWYPTPTVLGTGQVMTFSGLTETGGTNSAVEIYTPGAGWGPEYPAGWTPPLYPRMHLLPNGNVFYSGSGRTSRTFNPTTQVWTTGATTNYASSRPYGTSVLLPLSPADNYRARVMILGGGGTSTNTTEIIEPLASTPSWQYAASMSQSRIQLNATLLPSGRVLVTGGSGQDENAATASLNADLYNPANNTFSQAGANAFARLYHSNALLLPDARVLLAGGNPSRDSYEARMEIYSPAYLFNGDTPAQRPTITGVPAGTIDYGASFQIQTPDASSIASVVLIRPGTPTHAFDQDQRMVRLSFTAGAGSLDVTAPPNGNIAPPGYYMLFVLNSAGVPSVARFIGLAASAPSGDWKFCAAEGGFCAFAGTEEVRYGAQTAFVYQTHTNGVSCTNATFTDPIFGVEKACYIRGTVLPPPVSEWTSCAVEGGFCSFTGTKEVRYGAGSAFVYQIHTGGVACTNEVFTDPLPGVGKACDFRESVAAAPSSPTNLTATAASASQINLTWNDTSANETGFVIQRCQGAGCSTFASIITLGANVTSYSNTGLTASTSYSYRVAATNGTGTSGYSNTATAATQGTGPSAPSNLNASATSASQINLTWSDTSGNETGFIIERCQGAGCSTFASIITLGANVTSYSNTGLTASTSYSYRVAATNGAGTSGYSNTATATTQGTIPSAPSGLNASAASATQINLTWTDASANETGFIIERCQGVGCSTFAPIITLGANVTSYSNTGLTASTSYSYRVAATNGTGTSGYSNTATAATQAASSVQLTVTGYKVKGMQQADLTWSGATSANVDVYRNNVQILTTVNDGVHTDNINTRGGGSYTYRVCEAGTSTCSNDVTITF